MPILMVLNSVRRWFKKFKKEEAITVGPKIVAQIKKKEHPLEITLKNVGNELCTGGKLYCFASAGRKLPERQVLERDFGYMYPFGERDFTLVDINAEDKKLIIRVEYEGPRGERYSARQNIYIGD